MILGRWGATDAEVAGSVVGDDLFPDARLVATRCITIAAPPEAVFPWLRQMGFGRAGWYSYDWLDNLGRRSATSIDPRWQTLEAGDTVPAGPIGFEAVVVDPPRAFVMRLARSGRDGARRSRVTFQLAYELRPCAEGTRLVTRLRAKVDLPGGRAVESTVLGPGDGVMVRRQLRNVARRAEAAAIGCG